jgi:hypothetical protein
MQNELSPLHETIIIDRKCIKLFGFKPQKFGLYFSSLLGVCTYMGIQYLNRYPYHIQHLIPSLLNTDASHESVELFEFENVAKNESFPCLCIPLLE